MLSTFLRQQSVYIVAECAFKIVSFGSLHRESDLFLVGSEELQYCVR